MGDVVKLVAGEQEICILCNLEHQYIAVPQQHQVEIIIDHALFLGEYTDRINNLRNIHVLDIF